MDIFSRKKRSEIMSKVRNKDSKIEILFRKEIWKAGFRYRKNPTNYFGKPDLVLKKYKTVVFVDSCFWHGCKRHREFPKTRKRFWENKISGNIKRDKKVNSHYKKVGWSIIRVWEHDVKNNLNKIVSKVTTGLNKLGIE